MIVDFDNYFKSSIVWVIIHHLYIDHQYHYKGIGSKLLKAVTDKITYPIRLKCLERNIQGINFYKKKGFIAKDKGVSEQDVYILFELPSPQINYSY